MNEKLGTTTVHTREADIAATSRSGPGEISKQKELGYTFQRPSLPQREIAMERSNTEKVITEKQSFKSEKMDEHSGAGEVRKGNKGATTSLGLGKKAPEEILDEKSAVFKNGRETTNLGSSDKKASEETPVISRRPANPFAKKSNIQEEASSLIDSLKKMKKIDTTVKR